MTAPDPGRRRFLGVVTLLGCAVAAGLGWALRPQTETTTTSTVAAPATTTTPPSTTAAVRTTEAPTTTTEAPTTTTEPPTTTTLPPAAVVPVISREGWGASPVNGEPTAHTIERMTVHHTGAFLAANADAPSHIRTHQVFHQRDRGWIDLAYHYMIDAEGNVYEGRDHRSVGDTATTYDPTGHLLICCEGHFDEQDLPDAQRDALVAMLAWGARRFSVDPATIAGHRDLASTSCPGEAVYQLIASGELVERVADMMATGGVRLRRLDAAASTERVAAIEDG